MQTRILYIFTRTPLHVGAGSSVGAIDQPVIRERHTGFPVIPGSTLKGVFADAWNDELLRIEKEVEDKKTKEKKTVVSYVRPDTDPAKEVSWLFGNEDANAAAAGALLFGEASLIAFPVRSAKGGYAWVTSPLAINRAIRDGALPAIAAADFQEPSADSAFFSAAKLGLATPVQAVLEDQPLAHAGEIPGALAKAFATLPGFTDTTRLVLVSDGTLSYFATTACEVAQHVRINDATGTATTGGLFNQENVPADTLFYATLHVPGRVGSAPARTPEAAISAFQRKLTAANGLFQFGADASTGLGYSTVTLK